MHARALVLASILLALSGCGGSSSKEICNDGVDNDGNGKIDCADAACGVGALCGAHGLTCAADATCTVCSGNGGASEPAETVCGDGVDNDCDGKVDCDDPDCQPSGDRPGGICDALGHRCGAPDNLGHAGCVDAVGLGTAAVGSVRFVEADYFVLGTRGSGHHEQATLTFEVTRQDGKPYAGVTISFDHLSQGGSFLGFDPSTCTTQAPRTCTATAQTDKDGRARVLLTSGTSYASLAVRATVTAAGQSRSVTAGGFTVVGAKPNGAHLSLDCEYHNIPALTHHDCVYSNYCVNGGAVACTAKLADRFGVVVGFPTPVAFRAEAGAVPPAVLSNAFDLASGGNMDVGHAVGYLEACNSTLPFDVDPMPGEYAIAGMDWGCGARTVNPRDGLVTLIAMVRGEEGYVDVNLNGQWDPGEPYVDLPEPFVDVDDDGVWEPGEWYLDVDGDGTYSGPNGRWDADTILWTQTRLLYTGYPVAVSQGPNQLFTRFVEPAYLSGLPGPTPTPPPFALTAAGMASYTLWFTDEYLNPLTHFTEYSVDTVTGKAKAKLSSMSGTADSMGASFRQLFCAGQSLDATCKDGPVEQGCTTSPCHVVWDVGFCRTGACRFQYGSSAAATVSCAGVGADTVTATADIQGVRTSFQLSGTCSP